MTVLCTESTYHLSKLCGTLNKMKFLLGCFVIFFASQNLVDSAKILGVFHFPSKSHHILGKTLLKELAKRGHEVTMVSPFPDKKPSANYTDIYLDGVLEVKNEYFTFANESSASKQFMVALDFFPKICRLIANHPNLKNLVDSGAKFDVAIIFSAGFESLLGYMDQLNVPVILFSPVSANVFTTYHSINPMPYSYVPHMALAYSDKMTFLQRSANTLTNIITELFFSLVYIPFQERVYKEVFPNGKPLHELLEKIDLFLVNSHHTTETLRPYLPNLIQIGGFHMHGDEDLPADIKKYLDDATDGVVYVSFGTNVDAKMFSTYQKTALLNTLGKLKLRTLWKFEEDIKEKPANVRIENWLPQKSVLAHPNVKLFITHGGMGSMAETIYYGVPVIGIPFFGDQQSNVEEAVMQGYGVKVHKDELTEENLSKAVQEVLTNKHFKEKINNQSLLYREQPINPMNKAIFWVEHVIKHKGAKHLKPQSMSLPFYQYYLLDVIAFLATIVIISSLLTYYVTKKVLKFICRKVFKCGKVKNVKLKSQ